MEKEALLWREAGDKKVKCGLCAWRCTIKEGKRGICKVRENRKGTLYTLNYALASSIAADPIEKKPLFHFYPGSMVFSLGTIGCNFRCLHCQNYSISQTLLDEERDRLQEIMPEKAIEMARNYDCQGIAWTYNEPTIWFEYTYDSARLAKEAGLYTVYVTNGYMTGEALEMISPYLDAMNIDVKAFEPGFYKKVSSAKLDPVMETVEGAWEKGIHIEITYLVIPGQNDREEGFRRFVEWVAGIDEAIPVHFTRFHPDYKMLHLKPTPVKTLEKAREIGREKLKYVYTGNVFGHEGENTYCYNCGEMLIERRGFQAKRLNLSENKCLNCGSKIDIID